MATTTQSIDLVIVEWEDVEGGTLSDATIERAYGASGAGILAIRGVPGFVEAKNNCLRTAHTLATLPTSYLEENLTDPSTLYNAGWSHGKEKMGDKPDTAKASFYFNPITDTPGTAEDRKQYPLSYPSNVWPQHESLPRFKEKAQNLGRILTDACVALSKHLDRYIETRASNLVPKDMLFNALNNTEKVKGRLLYYFPLPPNQSASEDSWIGWHNDSGFLTALAGDMYLNHETGERITSPDPSAGLYVVDRENKVCKVDVPPDCLAIQVGECAQIVSHDTLRATPHCVRGSPGLARTSLACFVDVPPQFKLDGSVSSTCTRVPPLQGRWESGMTFGDFLSITFKKYYEWTTGSASL